MFVYRGDERREGDGRFAKCVTEKQFPRVLFELHDVHGHLQPKSRWEEPIYWVFHRPN